MFWVETRDATHVQKSENRMRFRTVRVALNYTFGKPPQPTDAARETSWLTGWLNFENERLEDVAAEFNRYSPRKIVLADAELGDTPVSGRFEADDVEAFTRALAKYEIARVESAGADEIRLAAPE